MCNPIENRYAWKTNGAINWTGDDAKQIDCDFSCKGGFKYHNTGKNRGCTACRVDQWTPDDNQSPDCKPCNPIPPNAHYTGPSNSAKCKWECDPGYNQVGNSCRKAVWTKRDRDVCRNTGNRRDSYKSIFRVCSDGYSDNVSAQICNHWGSKPNDYTRETSDDSCNPPTWVNVGCDSCRPNDCGTIEVKCTEELQDPAGTSYGTRYTKENRYCGQCYTPPPQNNNCKCDNPKENDREGNVLTSCQLGNPGDYKVSYDSIEYICKKRVQGVGYCDPVTCERNCKEGYKLKVEWVDREVFGQTITYANAECVPSGSSNPTPTPNPNPPAPNPPTPPAPAQPECGSSIFECSAGSVRNTQAGGDRFSWVCTNSAGTSKSCSYRCTGDANIAYNGNSSSFYGSTPACVQCTNFGQTHTIPDTSCSNYGRIISCGAVGTYVSGTEKTCKCENSSKQFEGKFYPQVPDSPSICGGGNNIADNLKIKFNLTCSAAPFSSISFGNNPTKLSLSRDSSFGGVDGYSIEVPVASNGAPPSSGYPILVRGYPVSRYVSSATIYSKGRGNDYQFSFSLPSDTIPTDQSITSFDVWLGDCNRTP